MASDDVDTAGSGDQLSPRRSPRSPTRGRAGAAATSHGTGATSLERLPRSAAAAPTRGLRGAPGVGVQDKVANSRSSSRSANQTGRASTRTSLESLPPPPAPASPAATTPPTRRSGRGVDREQHGAGPGAGAEPVPVATRRSNAEVNALLGLDAAVGYRGRVAREGTRT